MVMWTRTCPKAVVAFEISKTDFYLSKIRYKERLGCFI